MKCLHEIAPELLTGRRVIVRADFNVPISKSGSVDEPARIDAALKTVSYLRNSGARIIVLSHIGREPGETLRPVFAYLKKKLPITFVDSWEEDGIRSAVSALKDGEVVMLENLRAKKEEEENDPAFAEFLASLGDMYVNDAFSVSHRAHASVVGIPEHLKSYCGCQFKSEFENISKVFNPEHPFIVLMGGAKFETKIPVIESLLDKADTIFIGGALANDILKANGYEVGQSKVNDMDAEYAKKIFNDKKVLVVEDVRVQSFLLPQNKSLKDVSKDDKIIDGGPKTALAIADKIANARLVVWNGNFGTFEQGNSFLSTRVVDAISKSDAYSIAGGGDTVAELKKLGREHLFDFVSLSGGAMLEFIAEGTLPGIEALRC